MRETYIIYNVSHPVTGEIVYVGLTRNLEQRAKGHCCAPTDTGEWIRTIAKDGHSPVFTALEKITCKDIGNATKIERKYISQYTDLGHKLFNRMPGCGKKAQQFIVINEL